MAVKVLKTSAYVGIKNLVKEMHGETVGKKNRQEKFMLFIPRVFLLLKQQPINAINKTKSMKNINLNICHKLCFIICICWLTC